MAHENGFRLYDPFKREAVPSPNLVDSKQVTLRAFALIRQIVELNIGKQKANPFGVCMIHRKVKHGGVALHRWASVAQPVMGQHGQKISPADYGVNFYAGAVSVAESLLDGDWYLASDDEEAACKARDEADREKAMALTTQKKTTEAAMGFAEMLDAAKQQLNAAKASGPDPLMDKIRAMEERYAKAEAENAELKKQLVGAGAPAEGNTKRK